MPNLHGRLKNCGTALKRSWAAMLLICPLLFAAPASRSGRSVEMGMDFNIRIRTAGPGAGGVGTAEGDAIPGKQEILATLCKVNAYQLEHPSVNERVSPDPVEAQRKWPWPRATWYTGVMAVWKATHDSSFLDQSVRYGQALDWGVGGEQLGANRLFPIQVWSEIYFARKDRAMIEPSIRWLATPDPLTPAGQARWYLEGRGEFKEHPVPYIDSLYGASALSMLAKATGDKKYLDILKNFFDDVTGQLLDQPSGLFFRDTTFVAQRTQSGKKILWSRGNGWVFAGIARIVDYLPKDDPNREHYLAVYKRQAEALIKRQGADGLWRGNLDDPDEFPNPETSGTGFFCFGLAWGINHGVLNREEYLPAVQKAWHGLTQSLSPEGKVLWGQGVDDRPNPTGRDSTHEYVTGTFLLAGSEVYKLAQAK